jgi:hypothetical protein
MIVGCSNNYQVLACVSSHRKVLGWFSVAYFLKYFVVYLISLYNLMIVVFRIFVLNRWAMKGAAECCKVKFHKRAKESKICLHYQKSNGHTAFLSVSNNI